MISSFQFCADRQTDGQTDRQTDSMVVPYELYELYDWGKVLKLYGTL